MSAFLSSFSSLNPAVAFSVHSALLRVLDDCDRVADSVCSVITDALVQEYGFSSRNSAACDPFVVASSNACGAHLSSALRMTAANHFTRILHPLITTIASEQAWFEIDPAHAEAGENVDANLGNLERAAQWFLDTILMGLADSPPAFRQLLSTVASCFRQQGLKAMCQSASLCFFCQLILPLITHPHASLLPPADDHGLSPRSRRAFVYISECLRAVVSNAPFDTKSSAENGFMSVMNSFVVRNAPKTLVAFEHVITLPTNHSSSRSSAILSEEICSVDEAEDLRLIANLVADRREFFESWLVAQGLLDDLALLKATELKHSDVGGKVYSSTLHQHHEHSIQKSKTSRESSSPSGSDSLDNHSDGCSDEICVSFAPACDDESQSIKVSSTAISPTSSVLNAAHSSPAVSPSHAPDLAVSSVNTDAPQIAAASCLAAQSISVEGSSLSPVSFLVQSHIGVLPPSSPLSRTSQAAHGRVYQSSDIIPSRNALVAKAFAANTAGYTNPAVEPGTTLLDSGGDEVKLRKEAEELELLLQHQLLSERTAHHGHNQQPHSVQRIQDENPDGNLSAHHGHNHQITQHHVLRIPDASSRHTLPEFSEMAFFADVIKPLATRPSHPPSLSVESTVEAPKPSNTNASTQQVARLQAPSSCSAHEAAPLAGVGFTLKRNSQGALCVRRVRTDGPSHGRAMHQPVRVCLLS